MAALIGTHPISSTRNSSDSHFAIPTLLLPRLSSISASPTKSRTQHCVLHHRACIARSQPADAAVSEPTTTAFSIASPPSSSDWASFSEAVSGEWDGLTVTFDRDGEPQQLPSYYVPEAYRDWGVELFDWQSQCSMLSNESGMRYALRRLMPTVGCEADAIAFTEDQQTMFAPGAAVIAADGGYTSGPCDDLSSKEVFKSQVEHCFPLEAAGQRVRIVHNLKRMGAEMEWKVLSVEVHREKKDGPYTGRRELAGCSGGGIEYFAKTNALDVEKLSGPWVVMSSSSSSSSPEGNGGDSIIDIKGMKGLVTLPLNTWSAVSIEGDDMDIATGVLLSGGGGGGSRVKMARQHIVNGKLKLAELFELSARIN